MRYWFSLGRSRWFGARFNVHLSVIVVTAVVVLAGVENPAFAAVTLVSFLGLIVLHEFGHAAVAHRFGYAVEGIWLAAVHGRCEFQAPETLWEQCMIAWGGVAAQLVVAIPLIAFDAFWPRPLGILLTRNIGLEESCETLMRTSRWPTPTTERASVDEI